MNQELIQKIDEAISKSKNWHTSGWRVTFGSRQTEVNSLKDAEALPKTFVFRIEAVAYWTRVQGSGEEAAEWGEKAKAAAQQGRLRDCDDMAYYAMLIEKPIHGDKAPTWGPVVEAIRKSKAA